MLKKLRFIIDVSVKINQLVFLIKDYYCDKNIRETQLSLSIAYHADAQRVPTENQNVCKNLYHRKIHFSLSEFLIPGKCGSRISVI